MPSQTAVFTRLVREHMRTPPPVVAPTTPCREAVARLADAGATAILVSDESGILGIVTEQDIARRLAFKADPAAPIADVMTAPVASVRADDYLFHAIARMRRRKLRHMPVVDRAGSVVGMVELHTALGLAAPQMVEQIERLTHDETPAGLAAIKGEQVTVAEQLFADNVPAPDILSLISQINGDLHARALALCLKRMPPPPVPFALLVMGSGGRGESLIGADQDNGLILADYDDGEHDRIDAWFRAFSAMFCESLDDIGLPLCRGGVMASNPLWRKSLGQWREQVDGWLRRRSPAMLRLGDIFFDFTAVWGERALAQALRSHVTAALPKSHAFLQEMHAAQRGHATALGWFGRLRTRDDAPNHHALNLKYDAGLPLVEAVRLLSLANGIAVTGTPARLAALVERGIVAADTGETLAAAFAVITGHMLRQQIADFRAGDSPGYWLDPDGLSGQQRHELIEALRAIEALRDRVDGDFTADIF